jgi:hypothetical protein
MNQVRRTIFAASLVFFAHYVLRFGLASGQQPHLLSITSMLHFRQIGG